MIRTFVLTGMLTCFGMACGLFTNTSHAQSVGATSSWGPRGGFASAATQGFAHARTRGRVNADQVAIARSQAIGRGAWGTGLGYSYTIRSPDGRVISHTHLNLVELRRATFAATSGAGRYASTGGQVTSRGGWAAGRAVGPLPRNATRSWVLNSN